MLFTHAIHVAETHYIDKKPDRVRGGDLAYRSMGNDRHLRLVTDKVSRRLRLHRTMFCIIEVSIHRHLRVDSEIVLTT